MHDVLVVGGGIAGLSLAISLRKSFGSDFKVALVDPTLGSRLPSLRTSALVSSSKNVLSAIGVWSEIAQKSQPIWRMQLSDSRIRDAVRPFILDFDQPVEAGTSFASMVRDSDLVSCLEHEAERIGLDLRSTAISKISYGQSYSAVDLKDGQSIRARMVIGADGLNSKVRRISGIEAVSYNYGRSAIVATFNHEEEHHGVATQHFLPPGPFAMLPLIGRKSSIVWTEKHRDAQVYFALSKDDLTAEVERRFGASLGKLSLEEGPAIFPLRLHLARRFVGRRTALVGDAAHMIHPLAGQGVNLAFRDIAALVQSIAEALREGADIGSDACLADYERARYFDTTSMVAATHGLHGLFSNDSTPLRVLRDFGMNIVQRLPQLKRRLIKEAAGINYQGPALLRGELP